MSPEVPSTDRLLHRFAAVLSCCVVGLIAAGGLVKSLEAGLAVPDWPLSYGSLNPPRWWEIQNVRAEHGHRLIAGTVALATVLLAVLVTRREPRRWVRRLAWVAVAAVFAQALLGGLTVLFFLPTAISSSHAALAQVFLGLVVTLAVVTSRAWHAGRPDSAENAAPPVALATVTSVVIFVQILIGAVMRHAGAGLAIPDFPLAFGRLVPPHFDFAIGIHYAHRCGALIVLLLIATLLSWVLGRQTDRRLRVPVLAMGAVVLGQVTLGAIVVLSARAVLPNTVHVATGGVLFALSVISSLFSRRLASGVAYSPASPGRSAALSEAAP